MAENQVIKIELSTKSLLSVTQWIRSLFINIKPIAIEAYAKYLIGNSRHGLKHYPSYKYITRARAYGQTFVSDKQRRYVMAAIRDGRITPGQENRTGLQAESWKYAVENNRVRIYNTASGSKYTMGDMTQANMMRLIGWRKVSDVVKTNVRGAIRYAQAAVNQFLKSRSK